MSIFSLILIGCTKNSSIEKEKITIPSWYLNSIQNNEIFIYGEGESQISINDAKNNALNTMASRLIVSIDSSVLTSTVSSRSSSTKNEYYKDIRKDINVNVEKIKFSNVITEKSIQVNKSFYVLMKVNRQDFFENKKKEFEILDDKIEKKYNSLANYGKLEQINILQVLYPTIVKAKKQAVILNVINNDFNQVSYIKKYESYLNKITDLKENVSIFVKTNKKSRYFADSLIDILNQKQYRVSYAQQTDIVISLNNKVKYSIARGWNIAKVSTNISVTSNNKIISNKTISSIGRSSTSKESALENASQNFLGQIKEKTLDKVIFSN